MGQITSMTGFGSGSAEGEGVLVRTVLRSVNGRFLDLSLRCPSGLQELEPRIRERVQGRLSLGKVTGTIDVEQADQSAGLPQLNVEVAAQYVSQPLEALEALWKLERVALFEQVEAKLIMLSGVDTGFQRFSSAIATVVLST